MSDVDVRIQHEVRPDGSVLRYVRPYLGTTHAGGEKGKRIRPYKAFPEARTDEEAEELARAWMLEQHSTTALGVPNRLDYALARYVAHLASNNASANTVTKYENDLRYINEPFANMAPKDVTPLDVTLLQEELMTPVEDGGWGLSPVTAEHVHWFLSGAFSWMLDMGIVDQNPVRRVRPPKVSPVEASCFDEQEVSALTEALVAEHMATTPGTVSGRIRQEAARAAMISLHTGMREGEVCALQWHDVSYARFALHVTGTVVERRGGRVYKQTGTKGGRSRWVVMDNDLWRFLEQVRESRRRTSYAKCTADSPVIATKRSGYVRPSEIGKAFRQILRDHGLPERKFHSLRHTHATHLLAAGEDIKKVSARLGHSTPATTLNQYAHVLPDGDSHAADVFGGMHRIYND